MLGEQICKETGRTTTRRCIDTPKGVCLETCVENNGELLGISYKSYVTFCTINRPDGTVFGDACGVVIGEDNCTATLKAQCVGNIKDDGRISYRGSCCYETNSPKWVRLNKLPCVFEFEVDVENNTVTKLWEWR